ncbi:MAG: twin-arginine translocation pathway signal protein [Pseudomonadota bacterium]
MTVSRRRILTVLGGGVIVAAGGAGTFVGTRTPTKALAPWGDAGSYDEPRRSALSYAILAPNPHNRQPWEVDLSQPDTVVIWRDKTRNLPETDPFDRQLTIGMGCFLELMTIAAAETGHKVEADLFPEGEAGPVAVARFSEGATQDPLFAHVLDRRSCKEPFEPDAVPDAETARLAELADVYRDPERVAALRELTIDAIEIETTTYRTMKESVDLFRMGKAEINASPDGIDLGGPFLETLMLVGMLTREGQLDPTSSEFAQGMEMYHTMLRATPAYASIITAGNSRGDQITAGRRWLRLNLTTTGLGLALHPVSQALQEYPEMAANRVSLHEMLAPDGGTVQMLGRLGYGPKTAETPRWPLETRVRET